MIDLLQNLGISYTYMCLQDPANKQIVSGCPEDYLNLLVLGQ